MSLRVVRERKLSQPRLLERARRTTYAPAPRIEAAATPNRVISVAVVSFSCPRLSWFGRLSAHANAVTKRMNGNVAKRSFLIFHSPAHKYASKCPFRG